CRAEMVGADRPEMTVAGDWGAGDPAQAVEPRIDEAVVLQGQPGLEQRLRQAWIVVAEHCLEPGPIRAPGSVEQAVKEVRPSLEKLPRGAVIGDLAQERCGPEHGES